MRHRLFTLILLSSLLGAALADAQPRVRVTPALSRAVQQAAADEPVAVWVFLADKDHSRLTAAERALTLHARVRRERNRSTGNLVDHYDLPVRAAYVQRLRAEGAHVRHVSRWLNAVSVDATPAVIERVAALAFVRKLDMVRELRAPLPESAETEAPPHVRVPSSLNYGTSAAQIQQIGVSTLHDQGLTGNGVWIAVFDAGFSMPEHVAFDSLDVLVTRDFVNGDSIVVDQAGQAGVGNHGMEVLSVIGGYAPGNLIGPAFGASYILCKTENTDWERHVEEDDWVAAAEWVDSLGADIITSSLAYSTGFTPPDVDYTWQDMDGNTTIATMGADIAASRGILVVNAAGNSGSVALPANTLAGPADGDSVLTVGAVDAGGVRAGFSSVGPTSDGRTKPDVAAMGVSVTVATPWDSLGYTTSNGTSFSTPLVAGAAALLLEARPNASNQAIMDALRATASQAGAPDRFLGWGVIDAPAVLAMIPTAIVGNSSSPARVALRSVHPNPFNPSTVIDYEMSLASRVTLAVYDVRGRLVDMLLDGVWREAGSHSQRYQARHASGVYFVKLTAGGETDTRKIVLLK